MAASIPAPQPNGANGLASPAHHRVGPVPIFDGAMADTVGYCLEAIEQRRGARIATANLDFLALAMTDESLRQRLHSSHLVVADGAPVAALARLVGGSRTRRVAGVDLVHELCREGSQRGGLNVALYGGAPEVAAAAAVRIEETYPGVRVALRLSPPFRELSDEEQAQHARAIGEAKPDVVLVALGCPRQEHVIAEYFRAAPQAVWIGVGGTLDFLAGRRWRAPRLVQRLGLEWGFRMVQEPGRLWRRYLLRDLPALARLGPGCIVRGLRARVG
jgi:N-acetylglucosaminyldiphosphoundecaprenol N-acetyl-beta-D-mannosaminyltransferase